MTALLIQARSTGVQDFDPRAISPPGALTQF
jgi:hypothetical protein